MLVWHIVEREQVAGGRVILAWIWRSSWFLVVCGGAIGVQFIKNCWDDELWSVDLLLYLLISELIHVESLNLRILSFKTSVEGLDKFSGIQVINIVELSWSLFYLSLLTMPWCIHSWWSILIWRSVQVLRREGRASTDDAWICLIILESVALLVGNWAAVERIIIGILIIHLHLHISCPDLHVLSRCIRLSPTRSTTHRSQLIASTILAGWVDFINLLLSHASHRSIQLISSKFLTSIIVLLISENIASDILVYINLTYSFTLPQLLISFFRLRFTDLVGQHEVRKFLQREKGLTFQINIGQVLEHHRVGVKLTQKEILILSTFPHEFLFNINIKICLNRIHIQSWIRWRCWDNIIQDIFALDIVDVWFLYQPLVEASS